VTPVVLEAFHMVLVDYQDHFLAAVVHYSSENVFFFLLNENSFDVREDFSEYLDEPMKEYFKND
jgi:hypothetical protein